MPDNKTEVIDYDRALMPGDKEALVKAAVRKGVGWGLAGGIILGGLGGWIFGG